MELSLRCLLARCWWISSFVLLFLAASPAWAEWKATADFTACPRQYIPNTSGSEFFATEFDCKERVKNVKRESPLDCARYTCTEENRTTTATSSALDKSIGDAVAAGVSGQINAGDAAGLIGLALVGKMILPPAGKTPAQAQEQSREAERARQIANAAAEEQRRQAELHHLALMGSLAPLDDGKSLEQTHGRMGSPFDGGAVGDRAPVRLEGTNVALLRIEDESPHGSGGSTDAWREGGPCSAVLADNKAALTWADRQAREQGLSFLRDSAGITSSLEGLKDGAVDGLVRKAGAEDLKTLHDAIRERLDQARKFQQFMEDVRACVAKTGTNQCLLELAASEAKEPAKEWLRGLLDSGTRQASERAEKAGAVFQQYVRRLEESYQKQSLAAATCR